MRCKADPDKEASAVIDQESSNVYGLSRKMVVWLTL
jgi:hypothetical protein